MHQSSQRDHCQGVEEESLKGGQGSGVVSKQLTREKNMTARFPSRTRSKTEKSLRELANTFTTLSLLCFKK